MAKFIYVLHGVEGAQCINAYRIDGETKTPHGFVYLDARNTHSDGTTGPCGPESEDEKQRYWTHNQGAEYDEWFRYPLYKAHLINHCVVRKLLRARGFKITAFPENGRG